ncbi:MAG: T9SS type A sorting domain-containing protein [Paludibacteraceae bacterium]
MRKISLFLIFFAFIAQIKAQSVTITESVGWLESAYVKWTPTATAQTYNVYYSGEGITDKKIDTQLIRSYGTYFRADVLGLKAGTYTLKVVPVISGVEGTAVIGSEITVKPQDRTGYAFYSGRTPGAYNADGTTKANAVIIYITEKTKNTVTFDVVTNASKGTKTTYTGMQGILDGFKKGVDTRPLILRLVGQIKDLATMYNGDIVVENKNNASGYITIEGVGDDAVADGWGIRIKNATNIEVRNIGFMNCDSGEGDNVGLQQDNDYIWVHNCDMFYGNAGSDADQIKGDGALDCKGSTYITFSYNHFWDSGKSNLLGLSEGTTSGLFITYHHNWYDHSDSRHPRVRYFSAHVYNNYYDGNAKYGVGSTLGSSVFVEANYFRKCKYPMLTSMQGTDVWTASGNNYTTQPTFSKEDGGTIKAFNNYIEGATRFVPYGASGFTNPTVDFDAYVTSTRDEQVPATVKSYKGSNTYNNFDTNSSVFYSYTPDSPEDAKTNTMTYAGRIEGGDFNWTFNNAVDDTSYAVNQPLKDAITSYTTKMVFIQGEGEGGGQSGTVTLTLTSGSTNQTIVLGQSISAIKYTAGGTATSISVEDLPAGVTSSVNGLELTISGQPTETGSSTYSVIASDATSNTALTGTITVEKQNSGGETGEMTHNFTTQEKSSTFYTITGSLSQSYGTVTYNGLTLTQCLKMESSTVVSFTTTQAATLTLVFNSAYTGTIKIDDVIYSQNSSGIITVDLAAGTHTVKKGSGSSYLFYMVTQYVTTGTDNLDVPKINFYPNPVVNSLYVSSAQEVEQVSVYSLSGTLIKQVSGNVNIIDMSSLGSGSYLLKAKTKQGTIPQIIIKK